MSTPAVLPAAVGGSANLTALEAFNQGTLGVSWGGAG